MLAPAGYTVELAESARRAVEISTASRADLAILAPTAFDGAFQDVTREMAHSVARLIVVADQPEVADRLAGLGVKVDVCMAKPFAAGEVLMRLARILELGDGGSLSTVSERALLMFDDFTLDIEGHSLTNARGQEVALSRSEFALIATLASRPGRVLSRSQLLGATTRHPDDVYDRTVDVMIWRLRRKIELDPKRPRLIITVPGVGYKFLARVQKSRAAVDKGTTAEQPLPLQPVERRHVTVLAWALAGLDALSSDRDPDEVNAVIGFYRRACSQAVAQFAASVGRYSGEGGQFYFGYPEAHEHAAERAVRAGLLIVDAVAALARDTAVGLRARIGIASGLVVAGNLHRGDGTDMVGKPVSLAAHLRLLAVPDAVLIADNTRDLVRGLFRYKKIDPIRLPDAEEPIAAWQVVGESMVESRFDALRASGLVPMVGRDEEMELLRRRWRQSAKGDGRIVLISGEPGIGKSRLAKALATQIESEPHIRLLYQCSPYHRDSALHPLIAQIERAAGFETGDQPEQRLGKLEELLSTADVDRAAAAPLLAALLSTPTSGTYQPLVLSSVQRRRQTLSLLIELVAGLARWRPMLLIFEDAHWADATSLEWLDLAIDLAWRMRILIIVTHRLEFKPPWSGRPNVSAVMLGRLAPTDVRAMIGEISIGCQLRASVIDRIVARTDGIPLYVEELTRMIVGSASAPGSGPAAESPAFASPPTLQDSLMARIDSLGSAREVAQIAATIGQEFSYALLQQLIALDDSTLGRELKAIEKSELIFRRGLPPESTYRFTHIMIQEAVRETLPRSRRRALHQRIAELLCDPIKVPDTTEPEVVALHFTEAGLNEAGARWWGKAADKALGRSACVEAIANFRQGAQPGAKNGRRTSAAPASAAPPDWPWPGAGCCAWPRCTGDDCRIRPRARARRWY
jgi:DNA-binding response OmpR family regulator/class 3 adenylate cyclase